jgi:hypothetical protein
MNTTTKMQAFVLMSVQNTSGYPIVENQTQSTRNLLAMLNRVRVVTTSATITATALRVGRFGTGVPIAIARTWVALREWPQKRSLGPTHAI